MWLNKLEQAQEELNFNDPEDIEERMKLIVEDCVVIGRQIKAYLGEKPNVQTEAIETAAANVSNCIANLMIEWSDLKSKYYGSASAIFSEKGSGSGEIPGQYSYSNDLRLSIESKGDISFKRVSMTELREPYEKLLTFQEKLEDCLLDARLAGDGEQ